jgi:hypothetical protein
MFSTDHKFRCRLSNLSTVNATGRTLVAQSVDSSSVANSTTIQIENGALSCVDGPFLQAFFL